MAWYKQGTVAVTNANATVTGTGTAWVANTTAGAIFVGPDGLPYEIQSVNSDTSITLASNYRGSTASGQAYSIAPTQDYLRSLADQVATLIATYSSIATGAGAGKFGDGSAASPGVSFASDLDTGFYRVASNTIGAAVGGSNAITLNATGLGVGVTASDKFSVNTTGGAAFQSITTVVVQPATVGGLGSGLRFGWGGQLSGPTVRLVHGGDFNNAGIGFSVWKGGVETDAGRFDKDGNVIIGATSTSYTTTNRKVLNLTGGSGGAVIALTDTADRRYLFADPSTPALEIAATGATTALRLVTNGAERMRIDGAGGVGINCTADSAYKLDVNGATRLSNGASLTWGATYATGGPTIAGSTNFIAMYPNGVTSGEKWRLNPSGEVLMKNTGGGVGTPSGGGYLYVDAGALKFKGSSGTVTIIAPA